MESASADLAALSLGEGGGGVEMEAFSCVVEDKSVSGVLYFLQDSYLLWLSTGGCRFGNLAGAFPAAAGAAASPIIRGASDGKLCDIAARLTSRLGAPVFVAGDVGNPEDEGIQMALARSEGKVLKLIRDRAAPAATGPPAAAAAPQG